MTVKELKELLKNFADDIPVQFTDVCGNWLFDIYQLEFDDSSVTLVGDEVRYMEEE